MENEKIQHEELSMYDRNKLQLFVAAKLSAELKMNVEDVLLQHHQDLSELIDGDPTIPQRFHEDHNAVVEQLVATLLERHQERPAA